MTKRALLKWIIWSLAAIFYFYEFILRVSPGVMVGELMTSFGITASSVGILSAFYLYAYAPMQLPVGLLMDRYGIKKILSIASIVCGIGALLFASSHTFAAASLGRLLIGAGSAFAFIAMIYITSHWFPQKKRAFLIGVANSVAMLGASVGGGPLTTFIHRFGWRESIVLFGVFGIALGVVIYFFFRLDKHSETVEEETSHVRAHILSNLKTVSSKKATWLNAFVALLFYMTTTAFAGLWGIPFLQTAYGVSKEIAGYGISMIFLGWLFGGPLTGLVSDYLRARVLTVRLGILGALACLIPIIYFPVFSIGIVYALLFLVGLFSSAELLNFSLAIELHSLSAKATAAAFTNFIISCGDSIVQPLVGFLLDNNWNGVSQNGVRIYSLLDYQKALLCLPITLGLAFLLLFFIREKKGARN